jgi:hypothetical protein
LDPHRTHRAMHDAAASSSGTRTLSKRERDPICDVCGHNHVQGVKCKICGHVGKYIGACRPPAVALCGAPTDAAARAQGPAGRIDQTEEPFRRYHPAHCTRPTRRRRR